MAPHVQANPRARFQLHRLLHRHRMREQNIPVVRQRQRPVGLDHTRGSRPGDARRETIERLAVQGQPEPAQVARISDVEPGRGLAAAIGADLTKQEEFITFQDEIVIEHRSDTPRESTIASRRSNSIGGSVERSPDGRLPAAGLAMADECQGRSSLAAEETE